MDTTKKLLTCFSEYHCFGATIVLTTTTQIAMVYVSMTGNGDGDGGLNATRIIMCVSIAAIPIP